MSKKAFRCKKIYTAASENLIDGYVITDGDKISFVGGEAAAADYIDKNTKVYDFSDSFLMPGFHDFHVHLITGAMMEHDGVLRYANTEEEAAKMVWEKNRDRKDDDWILGGAWDNFRWPGCHQPTKASLDRYFPHKPLFLLNLECHGAWLNSEGLRRLGLDRNSVAPKDGEYYRLEDGDLSGYVHEKAVIPLLLKIFEDVSQEQMADFAKAFAKVAGSYGITSVSDLPLYGIRSEKAYALLEAKGELNLRINFSIPMMEATEEILRVKKEYHRPLLNCIGVKDFLDGTPMGHTGYMLAPYTDMPEFKGSPIIEPEFLKERVAELDGLGVKVRLHTCGDGAVRLGLDAYEYAMQKNGNKMRRHCIEHIEATTPEDIARFGRLGVVASVQPNHLPKYDYWHHPFFTMIGEERMKYSWPFHSLENAGAVLAFGTDYPVVELNPFMGIYRAVTRLTDDGQPEGGFNSAEKLAIHNTLRSYTWGPAYAADREKELGTLEPGKLADLTVLENDMFHWTGDCEKLFDTKVLMTVLGGRIVHEG